METIYKHTISIVAFLIFGITAVFASDKYTVILTNPTNTVRTDETIILKSDMLPEKFRQISSSQSIIIGSDNEVFIANQLDDLNGDGKWDEMAFLCSFKPNEKISIYLRIVKKVDVPKFTQRAHVHLGVSRELNNKFVEVKEEERPKDHIAQSVPFLYQYEGPGWENDKLAFRTYFDSRNGKDVFGKLIPEMVTDSIGLPGKSYHEFAAWGMDVLKVGKSLGAGALAITDGDSLYRLGQTESAHYKVIADGPVRAIFILTYTGWKVKKQNLKVEEMVTIWGGKNYFSGKISVSGLTSNSMSMVTGITTLHLIDENYVPEFIKASENYSAIAVNNVLSENKDFLALGLLVKNNQLKYWKRSPETGVNDDIIKTAYIAFNTSNNTPVEYCLFAGWEKSDIRFKTEKYLNKLMVEEAQKLSKPIVITF